MTVTNWDQCDRVHAEQDVRDLNIIITILTIVVVPVAVWNLTAYQYSRAGAGEL